VGEIFTSDVRILEVVDETVFFLDVAFYKPKYETVCIFV